MFVYSSVFFALADTEMGNTENSIIPLNMIERILKCTFFSDKSLVH